MTFLSARPVASPSMIIFGVPFDATSTFRRGSRFGPPAIRWASHSIESYSPVLRRDLDDVAFSDAGDIDVTGLDADAVVDAIRAYVQRLPPISIPLMLGGEHTITCGAVEALRARHANLALVQVDAHADLREEYEGLRLSHATVIRRIADRIGAGAIVQLGVRAGTRDEFDFAQRSLQYSSRRVEIPAAVWTWLEGRPVYVTVDIDAADPAHAPGTGNPEPDGLSAHDLLTLIRRLGMLTVVGLDVVEVSPPFDPSGRTAILGATIVREAILALARTTGSGVGDQGSATTE